MIWQEQILVVEKVSVSIISEKKSAKNKACQIQLNLECPLEKESALNTCVE